MAESRRQLLRAAVLVGGAGLSGCLRLTEGDETDSPTSTATDDQQRLDEDPSTDTAESSATITCSSESVPADTTDRFTHPFADSRNSFSLPSRSVPGEPPCIAWEQAIDVQSNRYFTGPLLTPERVVSYNTRTLSVRDRADGTLVSEGASVAAGDIRGITPIGISGPNVVVFGQNGRTENLVIFALRPDGTSSQSTVLYEGAGPNELQARAGRLADGEAVLVTADNRNDATRLRRVKWPSGETVWDRTIGGTGLRVEDIAVDEDTVVLTSDETTAGLDNIWALSRDSGDVLWSQRLPIGEAVPVVDGDNLYLPINAYNDENLENQVRAVSKRTGETAWTFEVRNPPRTGVAAADGRAYIVADSTMYAVDAGSGTAQWRFTVDRKPGISGDANGLPIVCQDTILLGSTLATDGEPARVRAVDRSSGEQRWSFGLPGEAVQSPMPADGALYTVVEESLDGSGQTKLYCLY